MKLKLKKDFQFLDKTIPVHLENLKLRDENSEMSKHSQEASRNF